MRRILVPVTLVIVFLGCKTRSAEPQAENKDSLAVISTANKQDSIELAQYSSSLTALFDSQLIKRNFNGAILVAKEGRVLYERYVGFANPRKIDILITDSTSFHLASTSKPFTGVAILKLVEQGKIALNDDIVCYFPDFPYANITVSDLLSHRSGLPNYLYFMDDREKWPAHKMVSNQDVLNFLVQYKPAPNFRAGSRFNYCNTNYVLLALIVEKVTGINFPQYLKKTIFDPLGMNHTFVYTPADSGKVIMSYKPSGDIWINDQFDDTYGDKNVYSTPRDLYRWDRGLYDPDFIRQTLLDSAFQPLSHERPSIHNYGLGWRMLNLPNGKNVIYHNGKWHGFTPAFARLTDEKTVIIILGNQYNTNMYHAAKDAYNVFGNYMQNEPDVEEGTAPAPAPVAAPKLAKEPKKAQTSATVKKQSSAKNVQKKKNVATPAKRTGAQVAKKPATISKKTMAKPREKKK